jgi:hypothetical protein
MNWVSDARGEVAVLVVDCLDAGAVDRDQVPAKQVHLPVEQHDWQKIGRRALWLTRRKSAMVLKSGLRYRSSQMT